MSRLGKLPITIPSGVTTTLDDGVLRVSGPKGELSRSVPEKEVQVVIEGDTITVAPKRDEAKALWGTIAAHARNMVTGVTEGFQKQLEIEGVGYRAEVTGDGIKLIVGFSHPVELAAPKGVSVTVEKNLITVSGADKEEVGQFAANIRAAKKPEPYKGKGIHYLGEYIIRKQGKKAV
jgi:large subunit ribosomal protein L6